MPKDNGQLLLIEPFYGGSHKQLIDLLCKEFNGCVTVTLPAKKWHWRARTSALYLSQVIPQSLSYQVLFCSSVLNLSELVALRPDLAPLKKVVYFHENQLVYPVRKQQNRDFHYGYSQIMTALVADKVVFNSLYNQTSFLTSIATFLNLIPDHKPQNLAEQIQPKCQVLYFPIQFPDVINSSCGINHDHEEQHSKMALSGETDRENARSAVSNKPCGASVLHNKRQKLCTPPIYEESQEPHISMVDDTETSSKACLLPEVAALNMLQKDREAPCTQRCLEDSPLHILWPHRWEHDKNPEEFFKLLYQLKEDSISFNVSVLGETYTDVPQIFAEAKERLTEHIIHWGYQTSKDDYYQILSEADVVISTANHEFFGVAMLEATHLECFPMCPKRLVYPEIFPAECLFNTERQMYKKLKYFCQNTDRVRKMKRRVDTEKYCWETLAPGYKDLLRVVTVTTDSDSKVENMLETK